MFVLKWQYTIGLSETVWDFYLCLQTLSLSCIVKGTVHILHYISDSKKFEHNGTTKGNVQGNPQGCWSSFIGSLQNGCEDTPDPQLWFAQVERHFALSGINKRILLCYSLTWQSVSLWLPFFVSTVGFFIKWNNLGFYYMTVRAKSSSEHNLKFCFRDHFFAINP